MTTCGSAARSAERLGLSEHVFEEKCFSHRLESSAFQPVQNRMKVAQLPGKAEPFRRAGRQSRKEHRREQIIWTALK
jgi:hypothetical protein